MKYKPEPLDCPVCHKQPKLFKRWDHITKNWSETLVVACACSPGISAYGNTEFEVIAKWNHQVDDYDPKFEKQRYHDEEDERELIEDMKKFEKMTDEAINEQTD